LGTAFAIDIVRRACTSLGVKIMSFLKEEQGGLLKKHWNLVLKKWFSETLPLVSHWIGARGGASETSRPLGRILAVTPPNTFVGAACRKTQRDSTARPWNLEMQSFPLEARVTPVELLIDSAVSLLLNLEAAHQGRSILFSDEQKLLFKGRKKGFA
jgi:hypothetical protein